MDINIIDVLKKKDKAYKIEKDFFYRGYRCLILGLNNGYRWGYVVLDNEHKYSNVNYNDIPVNVHGRLTYSEKNLLDIILDKWIIGFDCAHAGDGKDMDLIKELASDEMIEFYTNINKRLGPYETVKDNEYVKNELISLVDQLI